MRRLEDWTRVVRRDRSQDGECGIVANYDRDTNEYICCWDNGEWSREPGEGSTLRKECE